MPEQELQRVFTTYFEPIYRFVYIRVSHKQIAEDVVSSVFEQVCKHLQGFRPAHENAEKAWVYTIARNEIAGYFRKAKPTEDIDDFVEKLPDTEVLLQDDAFDLTLSVAQIMQAIEKLPDRKRELILLRYQSDFSNREIAEIVGIDEKSVSSQLSKAVKELRTHL